MSKEFSVNGQCMRVRSKDWYFGVRVLRNNGCSGVIVKQKFILDTQYTGAMD